MQFKLQSSYQPAGDQAQAINKLTQGLENGMDTQVLLGVTGSGKTFTMANVIQNVQLPTLIITHNKTLAGQLYQEFRDFFPDNAVSYFVSYYDYYQPEAYIPQTDTYIEKETDINEEIDKLRLAATSNLLSRKDVIVIASVSCIYNLGSPVEYGRSILELAVGLRIERDQIFLRLNDLQYIRSDFGFQRSTYRVRGETIDIYPAYEDTAIRIHLNGSFIEKLEKIDPLTGLPVGATGSVAPKEGESPTRPYGNPLPPGSYKSLVIFPAKHYVADKNTYEQAFAKIEHDLNLRVKQLESEGKMLEAHRIKQKVTYDLEMIKEVGYTNGIENYSRYFDNREPGDPPYSLIDYFNYDPFANVGAQNFVPDAVGVQNIEPLQSASRPWLCIIDESHMTLPQIRGMFNGDQARKQTLIDFGFRLPSALDNRPLKFEEFLRRMSRMICCSATPNEWEINKAREEAKFVEAQDFVPNSVGAQYFVPDSVGVQNIEPLQTHSGVVEQLIRPTGLIDPEIEIRPVEKQVTNLLEEIRIRVAVQERVLVTTLTKKMAEDLAKYLEEAGIKVQYLHSEIDTLERMDILASLRKGEHDVVVGINLLREGLDLPEVSLVAILDADKEGFLRSDTSLIQTMGRAARHLHGKVIMYADTITGSMQRAIDEVNRRRDIQIKYNQKNGIIPTSIAKPIRDRMIEKVADDDNLTYEVGRGKRKKTRIIDDEDLAKMLITDPDTLTPDQRKSFIQTLKRKMHDAAKNLNFELAAKLRDKIKLLE